MASVKTAISMPQSLFEQAEALAQEMEISRSRLFALAVKEFVHRHRNRQLLEAINTAYADAPPTEDPALHRQRRRQHRQMVEGQW